MEHTLSTPTGWLAAALMQLPALPVLIPLLLAPLLLWLRSPRAVWGAVSLITTLVFVVNLCLAAMVWTYGGMGYRFGGWVAPMGIIFHIDTLSSVFLLLVGCMGMVVAWSQGSGFGVQDSVHPLPIPPPLKRERGPEERPLLASNADIQDAMVHPVPSPARRGRDREGASNTYHLPLTTHHSLKASLFLLLLAGWSGVIATGDLFNAFVCMEIAGLAGTALIACSQDRRAVKAAFTYLLSNTLGAGFYLLGVGMLYAITGSLTLDAVAQHLHSLPGSPAITAAWLAMLLGLCVKAGVFPLGLWVPGAYGSAAPPVAAMLSGIAHKAVWCLLLRLVFTLIGSKQWEASSLPEVMQWGGALALLWCGVLAMRASTPARALGQASLATSGMALMLLGMGSVASIAAAVLLLVADGVCKTGLFLSLEAGRGWRIHSRPVFGWMVVGLWLAFLGAPLSLTFLAKWQTLLLFIEAEHYALFAALILGNLLALGVVLRWMQPLWMAPVEGESPPVSPFLYASVGAALLLSWLPMLWGAEIQDWLFTLSATLVEGR
jgi:multicomponent Na+:H+ antiporter subunit D